MEDCFNDQISPYQLKSESEAYREEVLKELKEIKEDIGTATKDFNAELKENNKRLDAAMIERIQGEIISFAEGMKHGIKPSSVAYEHIYDSYRKYKALGGNGFIDNMFKWIEKARERGEDDENNQ